MKKFIRKGIKLIIVLIMVTFLFTACGTPTEEIDENNYPNEPIRIVVPFAAGGGGDTMVRTVVPYWQESLEDAIFIVENMGGAGTQLGMQEIYNAGTDPYTIGVISQPHTSFTIEVQKAPYSIDDFACINMHNFDPMAIFGRSEQQWNDAVDLFDYIKEHPGELSCGVNQMTGGHLFAKYLIEEMGLEFTIVPYEGGAPARAALIGGIIDFMIMNEAASLGMGEEAKCLGVNWTKSVLYEEAKTMAELFPNEPEMVDIGISCANYKAIGVSKEMKEANPEIFKILVDTLEAAYKNEEHMTKCEEQGLKDYMEWMGPEKSDEVFRGAQNLVYEYADLFK